MQVKKAQYGGGRGLFMVVIAVDTLNKTVLLSVKKGFELPCRMEKHH